MGFSTRSMTSPSRLATVARHLTPASTPTCESGEVGPGTFHCGRTSSTVNTASRRLPLRLTVTLSNLALPSPSSR